MTNYIIASSRSWFKKYPKSDEYKKLSFFEISKKEELNIANLNTVKPEYIFFPHWNWKVEPEIYERYECVVFHTAPLPYGRGGSPIQNLIIRGFDKSPVCALKMTNIIDGGPIYKSLEISLEGTIETIFQRLALAVEKLILFICQKNPSPIEQTGTPVLFKRLSIADNELSESYSVSQLYDRVRMVDGKDYPKAYIHFGNYKIEFTDARIYNNELYANIKLFEKN